jgi:glycosyltransferase involved in cell wall biosynthesis
MKIILLIPIYNDRESLKKLIENINFEVQDLNSEMSVVVINDASSQQIIDTYQNLENINSFEIINMKENRGHTRCIASGLKYIFEKKEFDYVIPMDGDGEDRPEEIKNFIQLAEQSKEQSIVGERTKRSESLFFKICYQLHKLLTLGFTGHSIKFGNFTCLSKSTVEKMLNEKATWNSFSGSLKKVEKDLLSIPSIRGSRYFGPSKMSFFQFIKTLSFNYKCISKNSFNSLGFIYSFLYSSNAKQCIYYYLSTFSIVIDYDLFNLKFSLKRKFR